MNTKSGLVVLVLFLFLVSCARSTNNLEPCISGHIYGFWGGLWHGLIAPFDLLASLFDKEVYMYAPNNNGGWYALGFLFGSGGWGLLASKSTGKKRR
ncbi:MAG TPA: hypothetical protein PKM27_16795 [Saprospiraceae bacterium]|nr:hypothetical protein [Saprospiraceae bacterium]HNT21616.1 hypothetical protein [Saprospiraceae bacterium]